MKTEAKLACLLGALAAALPAQGYEWDHADGIGVRYLLYKKMKQRDVLPQYEGNNIRLAYTPTDEDDWVRIKGYPMDWGVLVYEFAKGAGDDTAESFEDFLIHKDPYLKRHRRTITVHGEPLDDGPLRLWEYRDRFVPTVYVLDKRAPGSRVWAESDLWGARFAVEKGMVATNASDSAQRTRGPNFRSQLQARKNDWVRLKGYEKPLPWVLLVYEFPEDAPSQQEALWAHDFEELVTRKEKQSKRTFTVRGEQRKGRALPFRLWQWTDDRRTATGKGHVAHHVAAVYDIPDRQLALVMRYPAESEAADRKLQRLGAALVSGLEMSPEAAPDASVGSENLYIAASCKVQDKEVALVVSIPVETGKDPEPALRARAERTVKSLQPQK